MLYPAEWAALGWLQAGPYVLQHPQAADPVCGKDNKVGTDLLEEEITKFEEHVQSVDNAAFNKI